MVDSYVCSASALEQFAYKLITALGACSEVALEVARHLVGANLAGHASHGVLQIPRYVAQVEAREVVASARPQVVKETGCLSLIDAQRCFGHYSTRYALNLCLSRARESGIAAAAVRHSTHIGRLGHYVELAAEQGMAAIVTVGGAGLGGGNAAPFGGLDRFLGTNPWAIGIPALGWPMVFDGATTMLAEGKIRLARAKGSQVPPDSISDSRGNPSLEPGDYYSGGTLVLLGGAVAGHKGYGLSLASALLGGMAMIGDPEPTSPDGPWPAAGRMAGVLVVVISPAALGEIDTYREMASRILMSAKQVRRAPGVDEILVPGEAEERARERHRTHGIDIPVATCKELIEVARRLGVDHQSIGP
jgi:hydroxycarboxylate dehydrogenase B